MFDFSFAEILVVVVVAVIFIGPKELPVVLRALARGMRWVKQTTRELKAAFDDLAQESGLGEAKKEVEREISWITGDDGKRYQAYDISDFLPPEPEKKEPPAS